MKERESRYTTFRLWMSRKMPPCREMVKVVTASMDERLNWQEWVKLKLHLLSCDACVNFLRQIDLIRTALLHSGGHIETDDSTVTLSNEARSRLKSALALAAAE